MNSFYILLYANTYEKKTVFTFLDHLPDKDSASNYRRLFLFSQKHHRESLPKTNWENLAQYDVPHLMMSSIFYQHLDKWTTRKLFRRRALKTKYQLFHHCVLENMFLSESHKEACVEAFGQIQKMYMGFSRLAYLWKWKRAICPVTTDLLFNEIDPTYKHNYILYQDGVKYYFRICDLMRSIEQRLIDCDTHDFGVQCETPINPYTKTSLSKATLYNIYFHMQYYGMKIPMPYRLFYEEQFNIDIFNIKHETFLRKLAIRSYVFNEPNTSIRLVTAIKSMLKNNLYTDRLSIHPDFPFSTLVDVFRPYVYLEYLLRFGNLECSVEQHYDILLYTALKQFCLKHPQFGRKIYKDDSIPNSFQSKHSKDLFYFYQKHTPFYSKHL